MNHPPPDCRSGVLTIYTTETHFSLFIYNSQYRHKDVKTYINRRRTAVQALSISKYIFTYIYICKLLNILNLNLIEESNKLTNPGAQHHFER